MSYIIDTTSIRKRLAEVTAHRKLVLIDGPVPPGCPQEQPEPLEMLINVDDVHRLCQAAEMAERLRQLLSEALKREQAAEVRACVAEGLLHRTQI